MKDIGSSFREAREFIGISKEEAANDLEISLAQLDNLEDGNANAFKDVFFLKELVKKYTKYLNLNEDEIMQAYNEFMFNYTSKIPVAEFEKIVSEIKSEEKKESSKKVISPYTKIPDEKKNKSKTFFYILIGTLAVILLVLIALVIKNTMDNDNFVGINLLKGVTYYEFTK